MRLQRFRRVGEVPFTSERKLMSSIETDAAREGRINVVTKGAPDVLLDPLQLRACRRGEVPLDEQRRQAIVADIERLSEQALRTLGVAYRRLPDTAVPDSDGPEARRRWSASWRTRAWWGSSIRRARRRPPPSPRRAGRACAPS